MEVCIVGLDLAKNVFQVHGTDAEGHVLLRRQLRRAEVGKFFSELPPCVVGLIIGRGWWPVSAMRCACFQRRR